MTKKEMLLERLFDESRGKPTDRALWHLLTRWQGQLPDLDGYFHKAFRQVDVSDDGDTDMAIWNLLNHSRLFWNIFDDVVKKRKKKK